MGDVVLKDMTLKIKVYEYKNKWDRVVTDQNESVIWEDLDKTITGQDATIEGLVAWITQMQQVPHWNIVNTQLEIIHAGDPLEDLPDNLEDLDVDELAQIVNTLQQMEADTTDGN